jgi:NAD+ kinase
VKLPHETSSPVLSAQTPQPDVIVIQKRTALERYAAEFKSDSGRSYFLRDGQSDQTLQRAHEQHCETLDKLLTELTTNNISFALYTLDDLTAESHTACSFYQSGKRSGLLPKRNLVICVGGDGTLLRASHYVGGDVELIGINSVPQHSVGHLCALSPDSLSAGLAEVLEKKRKPKSVRRLISRTSSGTVLPYALNDIYFGHQHPASASRYSLNVEGPHSRTEKQLSSGIWIATPAGSTAAIRSYGLGLLEPTDHHFLLAVREPYSPPGHQLNLTRLTLDGDHEHINLFSRMRHGIVCVDGPMTASVLGFGESLEIGLGREGVLKLFL